MSEAIRGCNRSNQEIFRNSQGTFVYFLSLNPPDIPFDPLDMLIIDMRMYQTNHLMMEAPFCIFKHLLNAEKDLIAQIERNHEDWLYQSFKNSVKNIQSGISPDFQEKQHQNMFRPETNRTYDKKERVDSQSKESYQPSPINHQSQIIGLEQYNFHQIFVNASRQIPIQMDHKKNRAEIEVENQALQDNYAYPVFKPSTEVNMRFKENQQKAVNKKIPSKQKKYVKLEHYSKKFLRYLRNEVKIRFEIYSQIMGWKIDTDRLEESQLDRKVQEWIQDLQNQGHIPLIWDEQDSLILCFLIFQNFYKDDKIKQKQVDTMKSKRLNKYKGELLARVKDKNQIKFLLKALSKSISKPEFIIVLKIETIQKLLPWLLERFNLNSLFHSLIVRNQKMCVKFITVVNSYLPTKMQKLLYENSSTEIEPITLNQSHPTTLRSNQVFQFTGANSSDQLMILQPVFGEISLANEELDQREHYQVNQSNIHSQTTKPTKANNPRNQNS